jgi:hypothetical protein
MNNFETNLFNKDGFVFSKISTNCYKLSFYLENNFIILSKIIDFNLIKLIYDLNSDIYESVNIEHINENEVITTILIKHFFEDLGLPQKYSFVHFQRTVEENAVIFKSKSILTHKPKEIPNNAELMSIQDLNCVCNIITPHKIDFSIQICFNQQVYIQPFVEKIVGIILHKIFKRVKQFIENTTL